MLGRMCNMTSKKQKIDEVMTPKLEKTNFPKTVTTEGLRSKQDQKRFI